jgi:spermidine synthase
MLGVTTYLSTDIAAVPLLWIVPFALYLLTLIVAFSSRASLVGPLTNRWLPLLVVPLALFLTTQSSGALWFVIPLNLVAFTLAAAGCHALLAGDRPTPARLAEFYFWVVLGGVFNTIIAPLLFTDIVEYPLALLAACAACLDRQSAASILKLRPADALMPLGVGVTAAVLLGAIGHFGVTPRLAYVAAAPFGVICFSQKRQPLRFAAMLGALIIAGAWTSTAYGRVLYAERTFFGVYRISVDTSRFRSMYHGTTLHGMQSVEEAEQREPLTYYHRTGPFGQAWSDLPSARSASDVAIVGLGVGTLASYAQPGQHLTFYEIDPAVERIARTAKYFTFLDDCGGRCEVVLGDARRSLVQARPAQYGLIVLDAFSSDAIPVHMMTDEAVALYLARLAPHGVLAFHISNMHLRLGPILARLARNNGLDARERAEYLPESALTDRGWTPSDWVVMARDAADLGVLAADPLWRAPIAASSTPLWTDDYSDLMRVILFRR